MTNAVVLTVKRATQGGRLRRWQVFGGIHPTIEDARIEWGSLPQAYFANGDVYLAELAEDGTVKHGDFPHGAELRMRGGEVPHNTRVVIVFDTTRGA